MARSERRAAELAVKDPKPSTYRSPDAWKLAGKGVELVASILVFALLGYWVDQKFERIRPWGLVTGSILGILGGLYNLIRQSLWEGFDSSSKGSRPKAHDESETRRPEKPSDDPAGRERAEKKP